jgi:hypothetical protein
MKRPGIRWPAVAVALSVTLSELPLTGGFVRLDIGVLLISIRKHLSLAILAIGVIGLSFALGGRTAAVTTVLILTPFGAVSLGREIGTNDKKWILFYLRFLLVLTTVQAVTGARLVDRFNPGLYVIPRTYSAFSSEPSFAYEYLFGLWLLSGLFCSRSEWYKLGSLVALQATVLGVMTVWQNFIVLILSLGITRLRISRSRRLLGTILFAPAALAMTFSDLALSLSNAALELFGSWRQLSNSVAVTRSGIIETAFFSYDETVADGLSALRQDSLSVWIRSAFSWLPFLFSIGGVLFAFGMSTLLLRLFPRDLGDDSNIRAILYCSLILGLYTAPKWLFIYLMVAGAASVAGRNSVEESSVNVRSSLD